VVDTSADGIARRLELLEAQLTAASHGTEVAGICGVAESPDAAVRQLRERFGVSELQAVTMADLQFRRTTRQAQDALRREVDELRGRLARGADD
jgi:DNA gyrase/topoisomerase IV subunit A